MYVLKLSFNQQEQCAVGRKDGFTSRVDELTLCSSKMAFAL
jgi:hypothetical protein